jgi:hypothetical protein
MKTTLAVVSLGLVLLLNSCGGTDRVVVDPPRPCPDDLRVTLTPENVSLLPGETVQPSFKVFTCAGTRELQVTPHWESADPVVATVDASSGLITAQQVGGNTEVTVSEDEYGTEAVVDVSVAVIDPIP